jgi:hypothetical protein
MRSDLIDITCRVISEREKAIAIVNGTMETVGPYEREKWFWLPRAEIEINDDGTITLPEWLAREKGLI